MLAGCATTTNGLDGLLFFLFSLALPAFRPLLFLCLLFFIHQSIKLFVFSLFFIIHRRLSVPEPIPSSPLFCSGQGVTRLFSFFPSKPASPVREPSLSIVTLHLENRYTDSISTRLDSTTFYEAIEFVHLFGLPSIAITTCIFFHLPVHVSQRLFFVPSETL